MTTKKVLRQAEAQRQALLRQGYEEVSDYQDIRPGSWVTRRQYPCSGDVTVQHVMVRDPLRPWSMLDTDPPLEVVLVAVKPATDYVFRKFPERALALPLEEVRLSWDQPTQILKETA
jgi:hypothetical protein